jgi:uncharacterized membrane protein (UPF0127 family)
MKRILFSAAILGICFSHYSCKEKVESPVLTKEVSFKKEGELTLKKAKTDSILANLDIEIAETEYETQTGLMYRKSMPNNQAMLFIFEDEKPRSFYMKNTEFSLDIIYINSSKEIVSIQKSAKPLDQTSLPSEDAVKYVLEVNAGLSDKWTLEKGDKIEWNKN